MVLQCILFHDQLVLELEFILTSHAQYLHAESNSVCVLKHLVLMLQFLLTKSTFHPELHQLWSIHFMLVIK